MADTNQTLFSFELFVEYVSVDNTRKINMEPAVAMRLLDFPTLLIYHSENDDPSSKPVSEKVHLLSETYLYSEENSFVYSFKKGKSCLFEINLNSLHAHLSNTPLYTMLLDVSGTIPKLIGSSVISLAKLTNRVKLDVEKRGIWTPASYGEKVISPILNLKGENIGAISLAYKIVSLGASLIPRISESKLDEICASLKPNSTSTENNGADDIQPCLPENITCNAPSQPDEQSTEVLLSETKVTHDAAETTQTEYIKKKDISVVTEVECGELLWHTFCPPPLFYCCREKNRHAEMESFRLANLSNKHTEDMVTSAEMECTYQINGPKRGEQNRLVSDVAVQHSHTVPSFLGDAILQLPLLNALIGELSHLSDQTHQQQHPFSVPPNLVWLCTSAEQPSPTPASGNIDKTGYLKTAASPIQTAVQLLSPRQSTSHVPLKGQQERPYHKSKLGYGLTRTFHLRLKQVKLDMTKHECREQFKNKKLGSQKKKSPKCKKMNSTSQIFKRDKNQSVGKLFSNLEINPAPLEVISNLKKNTSACKNITNQPISLNSLKAKGFYYNSDKEVQVHIPSMFRQNTYNDELPARNNHTSSLYLNQTNCDMLNTRDSDREDSRPCGTSYRPASTHNSVESDEYQEDFTSLDPTDGSPAPFSSPEPDRSQRGHVSSCSSSASCSFHGNTSHAVIVKMSLSPKLSLKGTHIMKPHLKTSIFSTSSDDIILSASISSSSRHWQRDPKSQSFPRRLEREHSMYRCIPSNDFVLESIYSPDPYEEKDTLASLGFQNKYQPISDLVINKLPGYTI